jgi:hypothetical protein
VLVADGGMFVCVVWALILPGIVGAMAIIIAGLGRFIGAVLRAIAGSRHESTNTLPARGWQSRPCPRARCGEMNPGNARFCGRCGQRL